MDVLSFACAPVVVFAGPAVEVDQYAIAVDLRHRRHTHKARVDPVAGLQLHTNGETQRVTHVSRLLGLDDMNTETQAIKIELWGKKILLQAPHRPYSANNLLFRPLQSTTAIGENYQSETKKA